MKTQSLLIFIFAALMLTASAMAIAADGHSHEEETHDIATDNHKKQSPEPHDDHDGHEEGTSEITPEAARQAGVKTQNAQGGVLHQEIVLTGRITLNRDTTAKIKARFPGIVRDVPVTLGQHVEKGDVLARLESNESLRGYTITAPISGVILERNTNIGDVTGDDPLFTIADLSTVWAKFHIFPKDTDQIKVAQNVRIHTIDHNKEALGTIKLFLPTADALSQTHIAIIELDNTSGLWRPGLTIDGHVNVGEDQVKILVPQSAIQTMKGQSVIFIHDGDHYAMRPVKTGRSDGENIEILSGLKAEENYVSQGSFLIKADILKSGAGHDHGH